MSSYMIYTKVNNIYSILKNIHDIEKCAKFHFSIIPLACYSVLIKAQCLINCLRNVTVAKSTIILCSHGMEGDDLQ